MGNKVSILVGADIVPTATSKEFFNKGDIQSLLGNSLCDIMATADIRIFNLETPLTDHEEPIKKCGPNLIAPTSTIKGISAINPSFLTLANNHIMDQGKKGLISTMNTLDAAGIAYAGIGNTLNEMSYSWVKKINGYSIGVYVCTEHEYSIATNDLPGANPFDPLESYDHVCELKKKCDYLIVLYHGGKEYYRYPSPNLQRYSRKFIDKGANIVICQHSHCIGCEEKYKSGTIVYGQGNFLFDKKDDEFWNSSLLIKIMIENNKDSIDYIPLVRQTPGVRLADTKESKQLLYSFYERSNMIKDAEFVKKMYISFAQEMGDDLISRFDRTFNFFPLRVLNKITNGALRHWYYSNFLLKYKNETMRNTIECEAWRELIITFLSNYN